MSQDTIDTDRIAEQLRAIFPDEVPVELRCISHGGCDSGVFDDYRRLAQVAVQRNNVGQNCYFGINPPDAESAAPTNSLMCGSALKQVDIPRRAHLLIDVDPVRDANTCSTEAEKEAAKILLDRVVQYLVESMNWSRPIISDSGNGYHALFKISLSSQDKGVVKSCLLALAGKFSNDKAKVDTAVHDVPRVCRLPGTMNKKGPNTPERPHRQARLLEIGTGEPVSVTDIQRVIQDFGLKAGTHQCSTVGKKSEFVPSNQQAFDKALSWISKQPLAVSGNEGNKRTAAVACGLVIDFDLPAVDAMELMLEYNQRLLDAGEEVWSEEELRRKLDWALGKKEEEETHRIGRKARKETASTDVPITPDNDKKRKISDAEGLVNIARANHELWHTSDNETFASLRTESGGRINVRIQSDDYRTRLISEYYGDTRRIPSSLQTTAAIETLSGLAIIEGEQRETFLRVGNHDGKIYIDLGDENWSCVEVACEGWRITNDPPIRFRRSPGLAPLPAPERDGNVGHITEFLNVSTTDDAILVIAFILMTFHPEGEYPILTLYGQQGSSKSTTARLIRSLSDPNLAPLRSTPRQEDDFSVTAYNNRLVVYDNLSFIQDWLSDALCRMATGGTNAKRKHYTDREEVLVTYSNPGIINGVVELARRPDLLDRCIVIDLPPIEKRVSSSEFWSAFDLVAGRILGGVLDALVYALANPSKADELPRMAEFAKWVIAAEPELIRQWKEKGATVDRDIDEWTEGDFMLSYENNILTAKATAIEQVPWVRHLVTLVNSEQGRIEMSATKLFTCIQRLAEIANEQTHKGTGWPQGASAFGSALMRLAPALTQIGIQVERDRESGGNRQRYWTITNLEVFEPEIDDESDRENTERDHPLFATHDSNAKTQVRYEADETETSINKTEPDAWIEQFVINLDVEEEL